MKDLTCDETQGPRLAVTAALTAGLAVLTASIILTAFQRHQAAGLLVLDIAAGLIGCALLPVLLRWPATASLVLPAVLLTALAAVSPAATPAATAGTLVIVQRYKFTMAALVAAAGVAAHAVQGLWRPAGGLSYFWWLLLVLASYAAVLGWGALARARRALLESLRERARRAEAEQGRRVAEARTAERARIAAEMHDVLAHRLSLVAMYAGALEYRPDAPPDELTRAAGVVRASVHQALAELREVILVLRDDDAAGQDGADQAGAADGTSQRPLPALADIPRLVAESHDAGQQVSIDNRMADPAGLPEACGRAAYWVVREGLTNARKHAARQPVQVVLDGAPGATLVIDISNPLPRDTAAAAVPGAGAGLAGLSERVHLAGGQLDHEVTAAAGFRLHAWLPWPQ